MPQKNPTRTGTMQFRGCTSKAVCMRRGTSCRNEVDMKRSKGLGKEILGCNSNEAESDSSKKRHKLI